MAIQSINKLKQFFLTGKKPTQQHFWDFLDSFRHRSEKISNADIEGLEELLSHKVDKKDAGTEPEVWSSTKPYVFDEANQQYVSYVNADSENSQYQNEGFYRLLEDTLEGESPESNPDKWAYQGAVIGDINVNDVLGLQEELDKKANVADIETTATEIKNADEKETPGENDMVAMVASTDNGTLQKFRWSNIKVALREYFNALYATPANVAESISMHNDSSTAHETLFNDKVDKVDGKGLSTNDYTTDDKNKLAAIEDPKWLGLFTSLAALEAAHPTATAGNSADVDTGVGTDVSRYIWDVNDGKWVEQGAAGNETAATIKQKYESNTDTNVYNDVDKGKVGNLPGDTNTELSNKVDKTNDTIEQYGTVPQATIDILLDESNWGANNNEFLYTIQTPIELGLYPGLELWNINPKYFYVCTNDNIYRIKKGSNIISDVILPNSQAIGGTYTHDLSKGLDKAIFTIAAAGTGYSYYDIVNIKLPDTVSLANTDIVMVFHVIATFSGVVNVIDSADNVVLSNIENEDIVEIKASMTKIFAKKW